MWQVSLDEIIFHFKCLLDGFSQLLLFTMPKCLTRQLHVSCVIYLQSDSRVRGFPVPISNCSKARSQWSSPGSLHSLLKKEDRCCDWEHIVQGSLPSLRPLMQPRWYIQDTGLCLVLPATREMFNSGLNYSIVHHGCTCQPHSQIQFGSVLSTVHSLGKAL